MLRTFTVKNYSTSDFKYTYFNHPCFSPQRVHLIRPLHLNNLWVDHQVSTDDQLGYISL